jgi:hypothetical protein
VAASTTTPSWPEKPSISTEDLIQRLLALIVPPERARASACAADRVDLVYEDDRRRDFPRLRKQLPNPTGPDADDHLDELRGAGAEEGTLRFAGCRTREQSLAGPGSARQQDALRSTSADTTILLRVSEEVDHLVDFALDFVDTRDIVKGDADRLGIDAPLLFHCPTGTHHSLLTPEHPSVKCNQQQKRRQRHEQVRQKTALLHERGGPHGGSAFGQLGEQIVASTEKVGDCSLWIACIILAHRLRPT